MMSDKWLTFGERQDFAFEVCLSQDPNNGHSCLPDEAASWGKFRLWVNKVNLCSFSYDGEFYDSVSWYLLPMFEWFADNWDPLFHEQRLPFPSDQGGARGAFLENLQANLGADEPTLKEKDAIWFKWWQRHAFRACREGGLFPDVFMRRLGDAVEFSWGNSKLPGMPEGFYFSAPAGSVTVPIDSVTRPLFTMLGHFAKALSTTGSDRVGQLGEKVRGIPSLDEGVFIRRYSCFLGNDIVHSIANIRITQNVAENIFEAANDDLCISRLSPVMMMFGSVSPNVSHEDVAKIVGVISTSWQQEGETAELRRYVSKRPLVSWQHPARQGYLQAIDFLEELGLDETDYQINLDSMLFDLNVEVTEISLADPTIRAIALAGDNLRPTIAINRNNKHNEKIEGKRFTIAHEIAHLLHDRGYGNLVSIASGPWAPAGIEKRANAFAAMLLMPPSLISKAAANATAPIESAEGIYEVARVCGTSIRATIEHLTNLQYIDRSTRDKLIMQFDYKTSYGTEHDIGGPKL